MHASYTTGVVYMLSVYDLLEVKTLVNHYMGLVVEYTLKSFFLLNESIMFCKDFLNLKSKVVLTT